MQPSNASHLKANNNRRRLLQALGFACLATAAPSAHAQTPFTWNGGTGNWSDSAFWNNGVPNDPSADVYIDGGKTSINSVVTLDNSYTVGRLTIDVGNTLNFNDNTSLTVTLGSFTGSGSIIDNGTININAHRRLHRSTLCRRGKPFRHGHAQPQRQQCARFLQQWRRPTDERCRLHCGWSRALGVGQSLFTNNGTVNANSSGNTLVIQPGSGTADFTSGTTGLTEATGGGTLVFSSNNGGTFTNNGTFAVVSGSTGGSSSLSVPAGALTNSSGTTLTGGTYNVLATDSSATSTLSIGGGTISTNAANVTLSGANSVFNEIVGITSNQGSFAVANGRNFTTVGPLANTGTVIAAGGSTLTVNGTFTQSAAGTITGNGTFTAPGGFTIAGAVNPGGTVAATTGVFTNGPDTTTFNGGMTIATETTFTVDALLNFELGLAMGTNDHITVNGLLNLNVTALAGFGSGTYDLIDYPVADYPLTNDTLKLGSLPAGYTYSLVDESSGQVDLIVLANPVPEPGTWAFVLGGAALLAGAQRRCRNVRRGNHQ